MRDFRYDKEFGYRVWDSDGLKWRPIRDDEGLEALLSIVGDLVSRGESQANQLDTIARHLGFFPA